MAPPRSETARRLFRALGRDATAAAVLVVVRGDLSGTSAAAAGYDNYLRALGAIQFKGGR